MLTLLLIKQPKKGVLIMETILNKKNYAEKIQADVDQVMTLLAQRVDEQQLALVRAAYLLAAEGHKNQWRKSGDPYICHPVAVARIVAEEMELGANPVMAAYLHDLIEDCPYSIEEIRERFGDDVAFLVGVVTKPQKAEYDQSKQIDNFRQILSSVQFDVRAILVKLADRLHNMRTLSSMRPDKRMKIASETEYFYAPLANRLGLYDIKTELEDLSFRYRCPREYAKLKQQLEELPNQDVEAFIAKAQEVLHSNGIEVRIELRTRSAYSIWRKMQAADCDFNHVDGKHYIRVVYKAEGAEEEKKKTLQIYAVLSDNFKERPCSIVNYLSSPKENGYRSFHIKLLNFNGSWEEIHISSENMVRCNRLGCIAERTEENLKCWLEKFRNVLKDITYHTNDIEYMDGITASFYYDNIIAFTPHGKCIVLPKGATALDFAFEIHTQLGLHALYSRINGKLCSVKTTLHRGDCVEIGTSDDTMPETDWLNHVRTYKAKRNLRSFFADRPTMKFKRCPCCHPLPGDEVIGFKDCYGNITLHLGNCPTAIKLASEHGDSIVNVEFNENKDFLFPVRIRIRGIDRHHLLSDVVACITEQQNLSISMLTTRTIDNIVETTVDFDVHSSDELLHAIESIRKIEFVDDVTRINIEQS